MISGSCALLHCLLAQRRRWLKAGSGAQSGFGLVELLVALGVGLTLSAAILGIYTDQTRIQRYLRAQHEMQEGALFALYLLSREIRLATQQHCLAHEAVAMEASDAGTGEPEGLVLTADEYPGAAIQETAGLGIRAWESVQEKGTAPGTVFNSVPDRPLEHTADGGWRSSAGIPLESLQALPGSDLLRLEAIKNCEETGQYHGSLFYVARRGGQAAGEAALFRRQFGTAVGAPRTEEVVAGLESVQLVFAVASASGVEQAVEAWVTADQVPDWREVRGVKINILMQSAEDYLVPAPQAYRFNGVIYDGNTGNGALPDDLRLRREFNSSVALRRGERDP